ncbi:hypothetical protein O181_000369 [Austropuccinia psidii MF-1]|uniref:Reverse transcriptase Ty1/copia-type domain-containing protein n=1 Tax=Austropuccinia psidii MF-1 TaxID=1389203 RepID=A0A9Q3B8F8_9BASI|nr:hypothetical protein [Austropuccinia psidii MF-1]
MAWYRCLKGWLTNIGFRSCTLDPCVFYQGKDSPLWLYIHVDDIAIFGREVDSFKRQIAAEFEIKDIGQADLMLGIKITQKEGSITLNQQHFSKSLFELYGMGRSQPASTLSIPNCHSQRGGEIQSLGCQLPSLKTLGSRTGMVSSMFCDTSMDPRTLVFLTVGKELPGLWPTVMQTGETVFSLAVVPGGWIGLLQHSDPNPRGQPGLHQYGEWQQQCQCKENEAR